MVMQIQRLRLMKNPVSLSNVGNNKVQDVVNNCSVDLIAMNANSMAIDVSSILSHPIFSYLYAENLARRNNQCPKRFTLFSHNTKACRLLVETNKTRLHIRDTYVIAEVATSNSSHPDCYTNTVRSSKSLDGNDIPWCDMFLYDDVKETNPHNLNWKNESNFDLTCLENCSCILGFRKFTSICAHGQNDVLSETLLIYTRDIQILSFFYTRLNDIAQGAFLGLEKLILLNLNRNQLSSISKDTFAGLDILMYLFLDYNQIKTLGNDTFMFLSHLEILSVINNGVTSLNSDVFSRSKHLREVALSGNNLTKLPDTVFSMIRNLLYLDLWFISIVSLPSTLFHNLTNLRGISVRLKPYYFTTSNYFLFFIPIAGSTLAIQSTDTNTCWDI